MHREFIQANPTWKKDQGHHDCIYVMGDPNQDGFSGLLVAHVHIFLSFKIEEVPYSCALVRWFSTYSDSPCKDTGFWRVQPDFDMQGQHVCSIIYINTIIRSAHIMGVAGSHILPSNFTHHNSLYSFQLYFINKYADHHAHELVF